MSEAAEQVTETAAPSAPSSEAPPSQQPATQDHETLDDVFKSFQVEAPQQPQQEQPQPRYEPQYQPREQQQPREPELPHIPDPALDPDGFRRYEASRAADSQVLRKALQQVVGKLGNMEASAARQREEADIGKALTFLRDKAPGVDDETLEVYLGTKARKDPRLLQVWNNRDKNPKAWDAALRVIGNEAAGKFEARADPQLAENQRAMRTARQTMATPQAAPSAEQAMGQLNGSDFDRAWERLKAGG